MANRRSVVSAAFATPRRRRARCSSACGFATDGRYTTAGKKETSLMSWIVLAFGAALSWGMYGASLHRGQLALGNPMRALLCVGVAYFLIGVLVPAGWLTSQGEMKNFNP